MSEWKISTINELYDFASGLSKPRDQFGFGYPFLSFKDVFYNYTLPTQLTQLVNTTEKERVSCSVKEGDVFLTRTSETQEELGISSVALKDYSNATFNGFTKRLRPKVKDVINPKFSAYYFRSPMFRALVTSMASMTTRASLNNEMLSRLTISYPSLPEQHAIAEVLSSLDDKIDLLHRNNITLEEMAETLFRQWFVEGTKEDWDVGSVNTLVNIRSGYPFKSTSFTAHGSFRLITIKNVQDGYLDLSRADYITDVPKKTPDYCLLQTGDILLSLTGNVGRCCLITTDNLLLNQRVAKLEPKNHRDWAFVYFYFRLSSTRRNLEEISKGTAQSNLSPIETGKIELSIPPEFLLSEYSKYVGPMLTKILANKTQIEELSQMRDTILPKLMSGQVRVKA